MMHIEKIKPSIVTDSLMNQIIDRITHWDLNPIVGYGMFRKHHHYAHIEIKMYQSVEQNFRESQIIWNVPDGNIPNDVDYRSEVKKSLISFLDLLSTLKGECPSILFEINNASFHIVDTSRTSDYQYATNYAIIDCFDKTILKFDKTYVERTIEQTRNLQ